MKNKKKLIKRILAGLFAAVAAAGLLVYFLIVKPEYDRLRAVAYDKLASMDRSDFSMLSDTEVYDKNGNEIGKINAGHYQYAKISDISMNLQNAYIAQEDRNFKIHHGVDYKAMLRAAVSLVVHRGQITQGGSTITQQVIKNTYLSQERSFTRKFVEIMLAPELEKMYTKADIMEFYCNTNFYGNRCYGVEAASQYYFGKSAKDLSIAEAATLAGISNAPSRYEPVGHPEECLKKRNQVLASMAEVGYITEEECTALQNSDLGVSVQEQEGTDENYMSSYAVHCATLTLMQLNNFAFEYVWDDKDSYDAYQKKYDEAYSYYSDELRSGGYKLYTSLDPAVQNTVQAQLDAALSGFSDLQENGKYAMQGAAVVTDNQSGYVVAVVGGRGTEDQFNRAYLSARQPGSTIKPLLDYGPAIDSGEYSPATLVNDHKWDDGPSNAGGSYYGNVTIREALNRSLNTVAWQVLDDIGIKNGLSYLAKMQFMKLSWVDSQSPSVAIGGFTNGVRVVDMARGFETLANNGTYTEKTCILRIEHEKNGELTANFKPASRQVYRSDTAWMLTDILKGTLNSSIGTGRGLALANDMPAAGKTGTTNDSKDTWFCGYTRYYTMAVWVGYDQPQAMPGVYGATYAGKIWKAAMDELHTGLAPLDWDKPETVVERTSSDGITDWASSTDEIRAQASLREKEQEQAADTAEALLKTYESTEVGKVEDVYTERTLYEKIKKQADILEDSERRSDILSRLLERKDYFDKIEAGMKDTIDRYEAMKREESRQAQSIAAEEAEKQRVQTEKDVNEKAFLQALEELEAYEYRPANAASLAQDAIDKLDYVQSYDEATSYAQRLNAAIERLKTLPSESEWKQQKAQEESASQAYLESQIGKLQESLSRENSSAGNTGSGYEPGSSGNGPGENSGTGGPGEVK